MQIVVLAGGLATRMRPITEKIPKAMILVNGKPFLEHQIELFRRNGVTDIILCVGYKAQQIKDYFGDGSKFDVKIRYSDEGENLKGTAGALKQAEDLLDDKFLVIYGDSYLTTNFQDVIDHFNKNDKSALCTVYKNDLEYHKNNMQVADGLIVKYDKTAQSPDMKHVDYGLSIIRKSILDSIHSEKVIQLEEIFQTLIANKGLLACEISDRFYEIGEPEGLKQFKDYLKGKSETTKSSDCAGCSKSGICGSGVQTSFEHKRVETIVGVPDSVGKGKNIKKVLLIFPHRISFSGYKEDLSPPMGMACLGAVLEKAGYEVKIIDAAAEDFNHSEKINDNMVRLGISMEDLKQRITEYHPDVVGVSCLFTAQIKTVLEICNSIKQVDPSVPVVIGGSHPSALPEQSLKSSFLDYVIIGEGEYTFRELLNKLKNNEAVSDIDGFAWKEDGKIHVNPKTKFIEDINELPKPARHLLPMKTYFDINLPQCGTSLKRPNTTIATSRGCTGNCVFCATTKLWGRRFRPFAVERVLDEMETLIKEYGIKEFQFIDDNLTLNKERAMKIFQGMIDRKFNIVWNTPQGIAIWALDNELLDKMKESGCYEITIAVESGDQDVLTHIIHKPTNLSKVEGIVKHAKKLGLIVKGYFVVGFPGEKKYQMQKTFDIAKDLKFDAAGIFIATPLPGTELYKICKEKGYLRPGFDFERVNYGVGNIVTPDFTPDEIEQMVSENIIKINMSLLFRNPWKFAKKYYQLVKRNPKVLFDYLGFLRKKSKKKTD
jgi:magnesium-protoporphyrin IX monomethyl ester (oxidative) cyclase